MTKIKETLKKYRIVLAEALMVTATALGLAAGFYQWSNDKIVAITVFTVAFWGGVIFFGIVHRFCLPIEREKEA